MAVILFQQSLSGKRPRRLNSSSRVSCYTKPGLWEKHNPETKPAISLLGVALGRGFALGPNAARAPLGKLALAAVSLLSEANRTGAYMAAGHHSARGARHSSLETLPDSWLTSVQMFECLFQSIHSRFLHHHQKSPLPPGAHTKLLFPGGHTSARWCGHPDICHIHQSLQCLLVAFWHMVLLFQRVVPINYDHPSLGSWFQCDVKAPEICSVTIDAPGQAKPCEPLLGAHLQSLCSIQDGIYPWLLEHQNSVTGLRGFSVRVPPACIARKKSRCPGQIAPLQLHGKPFKQWGPVIVW